MGFMAAMLGASTAASASSSVASETMKASESAIDSAVSNGMESEIMKAVPSAFEDDTSEIMKAGDEAAKADAEKVTDGKSFFSNAWNDAKQSIGIGGNGGVDMGKVGYNAAKTAISKGDSSEPQRMDPTPVQTSAPSAPEISAEDELNKLRNRMNAS